MKLETLDKPVRVKGYIRMSRPELHMNADRETFYESYAVIKKSRSYCRLRWDVRVKQYDDNFNSYFEELPVKWSKPSAVYVQDFDPTCDSRAEYYLQGA